MKKLFVFGVVVVVDLMKCVWWVKGLILRWETWPFGTVVVVQEGKVEAASIVHCIWVSLGSVSQTEAQRVSNLHHLKHIKDLE